MEITKGVSLQIQQTDKFKDIGISIRFMAPLYKQTAALRSMLAIMMIDRCRAYPSKKEMSDIQDQLYGLSLGAQTVGYGKSQVLEFRCKLIDPHYVKEQDLLAQVFAYLKQILFHPLLVEETFKEAKTVLLSKLQRIKDEPAQYVMMRGLQLGGAGSALGISSLGDLEVAKQATLADIQEAHRIMLEENRIDMIICGHVAETTIHSMIQEYLPFPARDVQSDTHYIFHGSDSQLVEEPRQINQSSIFMLWETNTDICASDYYALRLANAMFGQYPTSLLFQEVREKHSLCYNIYSSLISFDGALGVTTGVEAEHVTDAIRLIHEQFQRIVNGEFDEHLLQVSKTMTINSLKASKDTMNGIIAEAYQNIVLKQKMSVDDRIALFEKVEKADVIAAFKRCRHCLSFVVGKEVSV